MLNKIITLFLSFLIISGCSSSISSDLFSNDLELLSFKAVEKNGNFLYNNKNGNEENEVVLSSCNNELFIEAVVKNSNRFLFIDMIIYLSFLDTYIVLNEKNDDYLCSTVTLFENETWVTKINFKVDINFEYNLVDTNTNVNYNNLVGNYIK